MRGTEATGAHYRAFASERNAGRHAERTNNRSRHSTRRSRLPNCLPARRGSNVLVMNYGKATHGANWRGFTAWPDAPIRGVDHYMKSATFPANLPKGQGLVGYRMSNFDVVFYGDTAVATFVAEIDLVYEQNRNTQKLVLLDVYHKEPGGWIQVASNTSMHADELEKLECPPKP
jgi:hypothetical protein